MKAEKSKTANRSDKVDYKSVSLPKSMQKKVIVRTVNQEKRSQNLRFANNSLVEAAANAVFEEHPELFNKLAQ